MPPEPAPSEGAGQVTDTQVTGQVTDTPTTDAGQATGTDESTTGSSSQELESFTSIDPNTLSPENKAIYDSMLKDYRSKTESLADVRKRADAFDGLMGNEKFAKLVDSMSAGEQTTTTEQATEALADAGLDITTMDGEQLLNAILEKPSLITDMIKQEVDSRVKPLEERAMQEEAGIEITRLRSEYSKEKVGDLAFDKYEDEIDKIYKSNPDKEFRTPEQIYRDLTWDKVRQAGVNTGAAKTEQRQSTATTPPSSSTVDTKKPSLSFEDALNAAKRIHNWNGKGA